MTAPARWSVPEAIAARSRWVECSTADLLASPWRHALGVWRDRDGGYTSHVTGWRWTLQGAASERGGLIVSNDRLELGGRTAISDLELTRCLAAVELGRLDQLGLARLLRRRQSSGQAIGWVDASGLPGAQDEGDRAGRTTTLADALSALGLTLVRVEVRP